MYKKKTFNFQGAFLIQLTRRKKKMQIRIRYLRTFENGLMYLPLHQIATFGKLVRFANS